MQRSRTKDYLLLVIIFGACLAASHVVASPRPNALASFHSERRVVHISDITTRAYDDRDQLITYQPINQAPNLINDIGGSRLIEIAVIGFEDADVRPISLISSLAEDSCDENSPELLAWKIDKRVSEGKVRLEINQASWLTGKTLFLCVFDEASGEFHRLGGRSSLHIDG